MHNENDAKNYIVCKTVNSIHRTNKRKCFNQLENSKIYNFEARASIWWSFLKKCIIFYCNSHGIKKCGFYVFKFSHFLSSDLNVLTLLPARHTLMQKKIQNTIQPTHWHPNEHTHTIFVEFFFPDDLQRLIMLENRKMNTLPVFRV